MTIPTAFPNQPVTAPPPALPSPPIWASIDRANNGDMQESFDLYGPMGLLRDWALPALEAGASKILLRELVCPWGWLDGLKWSASQLEFHLGMLVLYTRPHNPTQWTLSQVKALNDWRWHMLSGLVFEQVEPFWPRDALQPWAVEPGIALNDPTGQGFTSILASDMERDERAKYGGQWTPGQQDPRDPAQQPGGVIPYFHEPTTDAEKDVTAWYDRERRSPNVRATIIPADFFLAPGGLGRATGGSA